MNLPLVIATGFIMAVGLIGTVIPLLPGLPIIWVAALGYGFVDEFGRPGIVAMGLITVVMVCGIAAKWIVPGRRAAAGGASRSTLLLGALAGLVGFFVIPVVGLPIGAILGVFVGEQRRTKSSQEAWKSTKNVIVGFGIGALIEVGTGLVMIICWLGWVLVSR
jgi:uncharacterized protein